MDKSSIDFFKQLFENVDNQINAFTEMLSELSECMFELFYHWRRQADSVIVEEADAIAQCMFQMMICKVRSIIQLSKGVSVMPERPDLRIPDIPSMAAIVRSMYELEFVFHNIFVEQPTKAERNIILYLWEIKGLNNRQGLQLVPPEHKVQEEKEKGQIQDLRNAIASTIEEMDMSDRVKKQIKKAINTNGTNIKGYRFVKDDEGQIIAFQDYYFADGNDDLLRNNHPDTYKFLSFVSHPSYISVLQFGQMYDKREDRNQLRTILAESFQLASLMCVDFVNGIPGAKEVFDRLPNEKKSVIR